MLRPHHKQTNAPPPRIVEGSATIQGATPYRADRRRLWVRRLLPVLLAIFALEMCYLTVGQSATVHLTPVRLQSERVITVSVAVHPGPHDVPARPLEVTQATTIQAMASGTRMLQAQSAHGTLLWFNASTATQTIPAHTRISISDGLSIETTQAVLVPKAVPPQPGQAQGEADATQPGSIGNLPANTLLDHACCGQGISVRNEAFSGGQDGGQVQVVTQQDVDGAVAAQKPSLLQQAQRLMEQQAAPEEQVNVLGCDTSGVAATPVGSGLASPGTFQVRLEARCQGLAFDADAVQEQAITSWSAATRPRYAATYQLHLAATQIATITVVTSAQLQIAVRVRGAWTYRLSSAMKDDLRSKLAGAPWWRAPQAFDHLAGIARWQITCWWLWLPADAEHITVLDTP